MKLLCSLLLALVLTLALPALAADMGNSNWSETDASNTAASPNGWPPGMAPNAVAPSSRGMMGALKRWYDHIQPTATSAGTANAQTLTYSVAPAAYIAGDAYTFKVGAGLTNTGAATVNVNGLGAKTVQLHGAALGGGELAAGTMVTVFYDGTQFQLRYTQFRWQVDAREYGANVLASASANTTALLAASAAAYSQGAELVIGGGLLPVNPGFTVYHDTKTRFVPGTCFVMQADGAAIGTLHHPGASIVSTNGDRAEVHDLCVDMNFHHGTAFINRAGMYVKLTGTPLVKNSALGTWTDTVAVTDTGVVSNGQVYVTGLSAAVAAVGMAVSDGGVCIPAGTQVAQVTATTTGSTSTSSPTLQFATSAPANIGAGALVFDGNNVVGIVASQSLGAGTVTLTANSAFAVSTGDIISFTPSGTAVLTQAATSGCASDALSFYPVLPDAAAIWLAYHGHQGAYYGVIERLTTLNNPDGSKWPQLTAASYASNVITMASPIPTNVTAMTQNKITAATWNQGAATLTTTTSHGLAAGSLVSVRGITGTGWIGEFVAARGTYGNQIVVGMKTDPGTATITGSGGNPSAAYYSGSYVVGNVTSDLAAGAFVTGISGSDITLNVGPSGLQTAIFDFTTASVGVLATATGDTELPNILDIYDGSIQGFAIGVLQYLGGPLSLHGTPDLTVNGVGAVVGGSGRGNRSHAQASAFSGAPYPEHQAWGKGGVWFTQDSFGGCADYCFNGVGFPSFSQGGGASTPRVTDEGRSNVSGGARLGGTVGVASGQPSDPTANATTTLAMAGMGGTCVVTPGASGNVVFDMYGGIKNNTASDGAQINMRYGTGTAPSNAASITGTQVSRTLQYDNLGTNRTSWHLIGRANGLIIGTSYWFDAAYSSVIGGTTTLQGVGCNVWEVP